MNKTTSIFLVLMLVVAGVLYFSQPKNPAIVEDGMTENDQSMDVNNPSTSEENSNPDTIVDGSIGVVVGTGTEKTFTVTGSNFAFSPSTMTVNKGDKVTIVFKNSGGFHDLKIDEFNVATAQIQGGAEETVSFIADKTGTFEYYCSVGTHRQMGMKGTLTVK